MSDKVISAVTKTLILNELNWKKLAVLLGISLAAAIFTFFARRNATKWRKLHTTVLVLSILSIAFHVVMFVGFWRVEADRAQRLVQAARQQKLKIGKGQIYQDERGEWRHVVRQDKQDEIVTFYVMDVGAEVPSEAIMHTTAETAGAVLMTLAEQGHLMLWEDADESDATPAGPTSATPTPTPRTALMDWPPDDLTNAKGQLSTERTKRK